MITRNDLCWCGSGKKWKKCHFPKENHGPQSPHLTMNSKDLASYYLKNFGIILKTQEQIQGIRAASHLTAKILDAICAITKEGVTTKELDNYAYKLHIDAGAIPAPLGYGEPPFPASICTSINEVVCHGIPENRPLKNGDIINIDASCIYQGYFGDCSKMVIIGETTPERQLVTDVAYHSLKRSTEILAPGVLLSEIGEVITNYAESRSTSVVTQFVGHGVGLQFHEPPQVPHCRNGIHIPLVPGMTFTIEPMINAGTYETVIDPKDHWTTTTKDKKASAQWEYTLLITEDGHEILTPWKDV